VIDVRVVVDQLVAAGEVQAVERAVRSLVTEHRDGVVPADAAAKGERVRRGTAGPAQVKRRVADVERRIGLALKPAVLHHGAVAHGDFGDGSREAARRPRLPNVSITRAWLLRPRTTSALGAEMAGDGVTVDRNTSWTGRSATVLSETATNAPSSNSAVFSAANGWTAESEWRASQGARTPGHARRRLQSSRP